MEFANQVIPFLLLTCGDRILLMRAPTSELLDIREYRTLKGYIGRDIKENPISTRCRVDLRRDSTERPFSLEM